MRRMMEMGAVRVEDMSVPFNANLEDDVGQKSLSAAVNDHIRLCSTQAGMNFRFMPHFSMTDGRGWWL